jgi:hypothetical protein
MAISLTNYLKEDVFTEKNRILDTYLNASHKVWVASVRMNQNPNSTELNRIHDQMLTLFRKALNDLSTHFSNLSSEALLDTIKQRKIELKAQRKNLTLEKFLTAGEELKAAKAESQRSPHDQLIQNRYTRVNTIFENMRKKMFKKFKNEIKNGQIIGILLDKQSELQRVKESFTVVQD